MATPNSVNTIDFGKAKQRLTPKVDPGLNNTLSDPQELWRRLSQRLHMTLEVDRVLETLFNELLPATKIDGIHYQHDAKQYELNIGKQATHSAGYRLVTSEDYLGEITFSRNKRFQEKELLLLESLLTTLLFPLKNALQYRDAIKAALEDPLTGAGNRIAMDNALHREIDLAHRYGQALGLLVIDLDRFKTINDNHGHIVGDQVLKDVVHTIQHCTRNTDMTFRYGGEEFVVLLSKTSLEAAKVITERIRHSVSEICCDGEGGVIHPTVSIGLTMLRFEDNQSTLFSRADKALYHAKNNGRNRVEIAEDLSSTKGTNCIG